ncbi:DUF2273 domain-containing protein [Corynebacterium sp. TAE3-ERU12]|uniref:DUF2273 domain-containing protein n=1 Tax=Corynebacterium sp. TAE3-ERU12 TaxID=2849491 RepID=UPI001C46354E|nr:DUF2273 domain-containing protein [Corynebacterium sp. TAE3-ERU12]MBV7294599.1 DUF2273 domain-containing protein [Corynebacterium sp. TAE3-ERU12]
MKLWLGMIVGLLLTLITVTGGFDAFILGIALAAIGAIIGAHMDGMIDLRSVLGSRGGNGRG